MRSFRFSIGGLMGVVLLAAIGFAVKDGLLVITSIESEDMLAANPYDDPFQIVGHCFMALIAAGLGGVAAPLVCDLGRGRRA
jgi:hypothetical protein